MTTRSEILQQVFGTKERNERIFDLYNAGVKQIEIARLFTVRGHPMSPQQVSQIIKMMQRIRGDRA